MLKTRNCQFNNILNDHYEHNWTLLQNNRDTLPQWNAIYQMRFDPPKFGIKLIIKGSLSLQLCWLCFILPSRTWTWGGVDSSLASSPTICPKKSRKRITNSSSVILQKFSIIFKSTFNLQHQNNTKWLT